MYDTRVIASCKKGASIAKFSISPPLNISTSKTYINIDQAASAPLVKQLFYLPFVKKVGLENSTLIVERFDILEWEAVIEEVAKKIEDSLNESGLVLEDEKKITKTDNKINTERKQNH